MIVIVISDEDNRMIEHFYLELNNELMGVAYSILQSHFEAEAAVQEAFTKIMSSIESFHKVSEEKRQGYCYMVVRNISINMYNKNKQTNLKVVFLDDCYNEPEYNNVSVEKRAEAQEEITELKRMVDLLDDTLRKPLLLRFFHGFTYRQIASALDIKESLARKRVERAVAKLTELSKEVGISHG